jgi:ribonuclease R
MKCQHCSQQEKFATECEREGIKYKQVEYLSTKIGEEFTGIISGAIQAGFWVELSDNKCEGFVEIQKNFKEPFEFDAQKIGLVSKNGKHSFFYGDKVRIIVQKVHLEEKKIWFKLAE